MSYISPNRFKKAKPKVGLKPGQDVMGVKSRTPNGFGTIGVTLPSYNSSSKQTYGRPAQYSPIKPKRSRLKRIFSLKHTIVAVILAVIVVGGYLGGNFVYNIHKLFGGSIFDVFSNVTLRGQDSGRVNILLAGNSADDPGHDGANLTDSIMLISIDTKNNTAFLLSIPRDLWVNVPGNGYQKINAAYVDGQSDNFSAAGYPDGGMGQLEQVVSQDLGISIDYYALIDYGAIRDAVNAVGGITIDIQSPDPRGLYDPSIDYSTDGPLVRLTNGEHSLDGQQALDLARARGDAYGSYGYSDSDFERTYNQRLMLIALKQKATSLGVLSNPVALSNLFNSVGSNVTTDLSLADAKALYDITKPIANGSIKSLSFQSSTNGEDLVSSYLAPDGEDALIPTAGIGNYTRMQQYVQQLTSSNPVVEEDASIAILNATNDNGLAGRQQTSLESKGLDITSIGDADSELNTTQIIDNSNGKYPSTKNYLSTLYGITPVTNAKYASAYPSDAFVIVLGLDQAEKDPSYSASIQ